MRANVGVDLGAREIGRVERPARRHLDRAGERLVLADEIPAAPVDEQIAAKIARRRRVDRRKCLVERQPRRVALAPVDVVEISACIHQLCDHRLLARSQS